MQSPWFCPKPVIAQIHGYCYGAASVIATSCDILVAEEGATFGHPAMRALGSGIGALYVFHLGPSWAKRMIYTGDAMDARTAERLRLFTHVVPLDQLEKFTETLARRIALTSMPLLYAHKMLMNKVCENMGLLQSMDANVEALIFGGADAADPSTGEFTRMTDKVGVRAALRARDDKYGNDLRAGKASPRLVTWR